MSVSDEIPPRAADPASQYIPVPFTRLDGRTEVFNWATIEFYPGDWTPYTLGGVLQPHVIHSGRRWLYCCFPMRMPAEGTPGEIAEFCIKHGIKLPLALAADLDSQDGGTTDLSNSPATPQPEPSEEAHDETGGNDVSPSHAQEPKALAGATGGERAPEAPPNATSAPSPPDKPASPRKRRRKGDAPALLSAALDSLIEKGQWGETDTAIIALADISRERFYTLIREGKSIERKFSEYQRRSRGRGPARPDDL